VSSLTDFGVPVRNKQQLRGKQPLPYWYHFNLKVIQFLTENKEHIERNIERFSLGITLVWQEAGTDSPFGCFLASFTKETHNQRITNEKSHFSKEFFGNLSHFPKEFSANPHIFRRSLKKVSFIGESFWEKFPL
jgi:hypothetical protein